jgi:hypothetical protein
MTSHFRPTLSVGGLCYVNTYYTEQETKVSDESKMSDMEENLQAMLNEQPEQPKEDRRAVGIQFLRGARKNAIEQIVKFIDQPEQPSLDDLIGLLVECYGDLIALSAIVSELLDDPAIDDEMLAHIEQGNQLLAKFEKEGR